MATPQSLESPKNMGSDASVTLTNTMSTNASLAKRAMETLKLRKNRSDSVRSVRSRAVLRRQRTRARLFHPKEVIGCDRWATWALGISALTFLLTTIIMTLYVCNMAGEHESTAGTTDKMSQAWKYEVSRADNFEKLLYETFSVLGIKVKNDDWKVTDDAETVQSKRAGQLWRDLRLKTHPEDRTQALYRERDSAKVIAVIKKVCTNIINHEQTELVEKKPVPTPDGGKKTIKTPWIQIPAFSDEDNKCHRMANVEMLRQALKKFRDKMALYSDRSARKRLGLYDELPAHMNLWSVLNEMEKKVPIDREDYSHFQRVGGNSICGLAGGAVLYQTLGHQHSSRPEQE